MRLFKIIVLIAAISFLQGCKEETIVNQVNENNNKLIKTQVDLQVGFAGKYVLIRLNNETVYRAILSDVVSFAGPEASFLTSLPKGTNNLFVFIQNPNLPSQSLVDSALVTIGDKERYYLGLQISDSLKCVVQDSSFLYM